MASGWVKSLQCKSRAFEDVYHPNPKNLIPTASCGKSVRSIKDVIEATKHKPKPKRPKSTHQKQQQEEQSGSKYQRQSKAEPVSTPTNGAGVGNSRSDRTSRAPDPYFPALTELPEGHPSRNVVEIIFHTSWSPKAFVGKVEMIFKVQNGSKTVSRFDEYREAVKYRAGSGAPTGAATCEENARCVADGNEVMRFYCLGPTSGGAAYDARGGGAWAFPGAKGSAICTFSESGGAHESAGGGRGRRAMLVCRVIAGRVSDQLRVESLLDGRVGFDSVSGENGGLLVFDSRAVLPCFLIIYKL